MNEKLALVVALSALLVGAGCGGDDTTPGGGDTPLGGGCSSDDDCESGDCEMSTGMCTEECAEGEMRDGFTCVPWGTEGPEGGPRSIWLPSAGNCTPEDMGGDSYTFVLAALDIGKADPMGDPNIVPGFNLDGRDSDEEDPYGCFHPDFMSPPPDNINGVDNQLGPILSSVGMSLDIEGEIQNAIAEGSLLILLTVHGVDDLTSDECISMTLELGTMEGTGSETPMLDGSGRLAPDQTFNVNMESVGLVMSEGEIVGGRVRSGPVDISLSLPIEGMNLDLNIQQARVRFDIAEAMVDSGILGGALDVDETVDAIVMIAPEDIPESLARSILEGQADLQPNNMDMMCEAVSIGLVFEGVTATRGDEVMVSM